MKNHKSQTRIFKSQPGVTLLLGILVLSAILAIAFSLTTIIFIEIRSSTDLLKTEGALYGASGVGEQSFFNLARRVGNPSYVTSFNNGVSIVGSPIVNKKMDPVFNDKILAGLGFAATKNKYDFCDATPTTTGCSFGKITVSYITTNTSGDAIYAYLCQWNPNSSYSSLPCTATSTSQGYWVTPDSGFINSDGSVQLTPVTNPSVTWSANFNTNLQQELIITSCDNSVPAHCAANPVYYQVSTYGPQASGYPPQGLPYVGKKSVTVNTLNGTVGRKIQVVVPQQ